MAAIATRLERTTNGGDNNGNSPGGGGGAAGPLAAAELAEAGCTEKEIAAMTDHRTLAMVQFYTRSADQGRLASAAVVKLANVGKTRQRSP